VWLDIVRMVKAVVRDLCTEYERRLGSLHNTSYGTF
jgi:hypothetical protein